MSFIATIAGTSFVLPTEGDEGWGPQTSEWMAAVSTDLLQRTGGNFTLTADVNFGANFATVQTYLKQRASNIADIGFIRMANAAQIAWRNAGNTDNLILTVDSGNNLVFNGGIIPSPSGGIIQPAQGGTGLTSYTVGDMIYASGTTTISKLAIGTANYVLVSNGTLPGYALLVNANIDAAAAIARSKIANGTASYVLINSGGGAMSEEQFLDKTRGGTGITSTATFPSSGVVVTEAASETLTNKTLTTPVLNVPTINGMKQAYTVPAVGNYTVLTSDSVIAVNSAVTTVVTLPAASGNAGTIYTIYKSDASFTSVSVTDGTFSTTINTIRESITVQSTGSTYLTINRRTTVNPTSFTPVWTATSVNPAIVNGVITAWWSRSGQIMTCQYQIIPGSSTTFGTGDWQFALPSGPTIDTTAIGQVSQNNTGIGYGSSSQANYHTLVTTYDTTSVFRAAANGAGGRVTASSPEAWGATQNLTITAVVPISGWNA